MDYVTLIAEHRMMVLAVTVPALTIIVAFGLDTWHRWRRHQRTKNFAAFVDRLHSNGC